MDVIELEEKLYVPLMDCQGNIRRLVDRKCKKIVESYDFSAFGEELTKGLQVPSNPWRYASKRTDPEFNLTNFGKRYYDPQLGRWITTDPAGFIDGTNLYVYLHNNPFRYIDPDGQFAVLFALPLFTWGGTAGLAWAIPAATSLLTAVTGFVMYLAVSWTMDRVIEKRHTPDQEALSDLVKGAGKEGVTSAEADILLDWANEYDFPHRDDRGKRNAKGEPHWEHGEHIHVGPKHVKVND